MRHQLARPGLACHVLPWCRAEIRKKVTDLLCRWLGSGEDARQAAEELVQQHIGSCREGKNEKLFFGKDGKPLNDEKGKAVRSLKGAVNWITGQIDDGAETAGCGSGSGSSSGSDEDGSDEDDSRPSYDGSDDSDMQGMFSPSSNGFTQSGGDEQKPRKRARPAEKETIDALLGLAEQGQGGGLGPVARKRQRSKPSTSRLPPQEPEEPLSAARPPRGNGKRGVDLTARAKEIEVAAGEFLQGFKDRLAETNQVIQAIEEQIAELNGSLPMLLESCDRYQKVIMGLEGDQKVIKGDSSDEEEGSSDEEEGSSDEEEDANRGD
eukprot:jgi/Astpho2/971/fgenesh1_pg.00016_%23_143_t